MNSAIISASGVDAQDFSGLNEKVHDFSASGANARDFGQKGGAPRPSRLAANEVYRAHSTRLFTFEP